MSHRLQSGCFIFCWGAWISSSSYIIYSIVMFNMSVLWGSEKGSEINWHSIKDKLIFSPFAPHLTHKTQIWNATARDLWTFFHRLRSVRYRKIRSGVSSLWAVGVQRVCPLSPKQQHFRPLWAILYISSRQSHLRLRPPPRTPHRRTCIGHSKEIF